MHQSRKHRLYPKTIEQRQFLAQQLGSVRFIYNRFLAERKQAYEADKTSLNFYDQCKSLTKLKQDKQFSWLNGINSQSMQAALRNLDTAYRNFFAKRTKFPKFKKRGNRQSVKIKQNFRVEDNLLYIPKLKTGIPIVLHRGALPGKQVSCTISKTPSGKYFASFDCDVPDEQFEPLPPNDNIIGIDLGVKSLIVATDGTEIPHPKFYQQTEKKLAYEQKQQSKKKPGGSNRNKQRLTVAKLNEYIANRRTDFIHKLTRNLINENQVIICESLAVKRMMQETTSGLAKLIADASLGEILRQLEYKAQWYGRTLHQVDRFFPSSKMCNGCKHILDVLPLSVRQWECPNCKQQNDRDLNAAKNIRDQGVSDLKLEGANLPSGCGMQSDVKEKLGEQSAMLADALSQETSSKRFAWKRWFTCEKTFE
jgi:putative transposase